MDARMTDYKLPSERRLAVQLFSSTPPSQLTIFASYLMHPMPRTPVLPGLRTRRPMDRPVRSCGTWHVAGLVTALWTRVLRSRFFGCLTPMLYPTPLTPHHRPQRPPLPRRLPRRLSIQCHTSIMLLAFCFVKHPRMCFYPWGDILLRNLWSTSATLTTPVDFLCRDFMST